MLQTAQEQEVQSKELVERVRRQVNGETRPGECDRITLTTKQLHDAFKTYLDPIAKREYERGKSEGPREALMEKVAALPPTPAKSTATEKSPSALAKRAQELRVEAHARGEQLSNADSVLEAYREAGVALE